MLNSDLRFGEVKSNGWFDAILKTLASHEAILRIYDLQSLTFLEALTYRSYGICSNTKSNDLEIYLLPLAP